MVEKFEPKYTQIKVKDGLIKSMNIFFKDLLAKSDLDGILIPQELPDGFGFVPALITEPELFTTVPILNLKCLLATVYINVIYDGSINP